MEYHSNRYYAYRPLEHDSDGTVAYPTAENNAIHSDQFDVLSFLSVIARSDDRVEKWTSLVFLSVHLGSWNMFLPFVPYHGAFFSVTLVPRKYILRQTVVDLDPCHSIPDLVALKTPILDKNQRSLRNSRLFRKIAKEYQILRSELLEKHENIVTLYGCCWQSLDVCDGMPIPSLILAGTKFGDLVHFSRDRELTLRERLRLCMHITSGLQAIHSIGIVHGDLKPENILVFHSTRRGYTAKIADFGEAILLSETALPSRKPSGTILYSAPECYEETATFSRDELLKTDIFSLGITLASLLQGMHILEEMKKLSDSSLASLKKSGKLPYWLAGLSCKALEDAAVQEGTGDDGDGGAWDTDLAWHDSSILADEELWIAYLELGNGSLAASTDQRYGSGEDVLLVLRTMLRLHLRRLLDCRKLGSSFDRVNANPEWWAHMSEVMGMSKARLRKVTGARVGAPTRLNEEEINAISHCCLCPGSFLKEAQFIQKHTGNKRYQTNRQLKKVCRGLNSSMLLKRRTPSPPVAVVRRASEMMNFVRIQRQAEKLIDLRTAGLEKTIFKATQNCNIFWLIPYAVKELLEIRLLEEAMNRSTSETHRADAAYEYVAMVFNSDELSTPRLAKALELLALSAQNGHTEARYSVGRLSDAFGYPLSVSRKVEIQWLLAASKAGSMTARRRLQALKPKKFAQAMRQIRQQCGYVCPKTNEALLEECQHVKRSGSLPDTFSAHVYDFAITGNIQLLLKLPKLRKEVYNCRNVLGETPLLVACRGGHAAVAALLLARGADPTIATKDNVTPLHFLGAFDDEDIPNMASLLLQHGAELEKVSKEALIYKELPDSPFGGVDGTPLLWAVAARNRCATQTLVDRGADPFMGAKQSANYNGPFISFPITWALIFHQHDLVEIMLSRAQNSPQLLDRQRHLNTSFHQRNGEFSSVLHAAIDCNTGLRLREYLIHGKYFERAALRCVQVLIEFGADPMKLTIGQNGKKDHPITYACISGNMLTIKYLWDYQEGSLRPTPEIWVIALQVTIFHRNHTVFDFLMEHRSDLTPDLDIDIKAVEKAFTATNDPHMVLGVLKLILPPKEVHRPSLYKELFLTAITTGQFEAAKLISEKGRVGPTSRIDGVNILGGLISISSSHPNMEQKVSFILSLPSEKDELFWNVDYLEGSGITALQAVISASTNTMPMNAMVFTAILKHFDEPKFLNAQMKGAPRRKYTGYSALHLAAQRGNAGAAAVLLSETGIEPNLQDSHGKTPTDICVALEQKFASEQNVAQFLPEKPSFDRRRRLNMSILSDLLSAGGRVAKFSSVIMRSTQDNFDILDRAKGNIRGIHLLGTFPPTTASIPKMDLERCTNLNSDTLKSNSAVSKYSDSLMSQMPVGSLLAFVDEPSQPIPQLPADLKDGIHSIWSDSRIGPGGKRIIGSG